MASAPLPTVDTFFASIADDAQRAEALELDQIFQRGTGCPPKMWSAGIVGYGTSTVHYAGGRTEDWMAIGFAPRAKKFAIYGVGELDDREALLTRLGKHTTAKACIYINRLADVDAAVLEELARRANGTAR